MSNIESLPKDSTKANDNSDQSFEAIIAANKAKSEKQKRERSAANAQVLRDYKIKQKG